MHAYLHASLSLSLKYAGCMHTSNPKPNPITLLKTLTLTSNPNSTVGCTRTASCSASPPPRLPGGGGGGGGGAAIAGAAAAAGGYAFLSSYYSSGSAALQLCTCARRSSARSAGAAAQRARPRPPHSSRRAASRHQHGRPPVHRRRGRRRRRRGGGGGGGGSGDGAALLRAGGGLAGRLVPAVEEKCGALRAYMWTTPLKRDVHVPRLWPERGRSLGVVEQCTVFTPLRFIPAAERCTRELAK